MDTSIITAIITGVCTAIPVIFTTKMLNDKKDAVNEERLNRLDANVSALTKEVREHNNFAVQIAKIQTRLDILERR